ncbi:transposase, partial [Escherichia coli]|nr:transposase [Escherichia coli]
MPSLQNIQIGARSSPRSAGLQEDDATEIQRRASTERLRLFPFLACRFADRAYRGERIGAATTIRVEIVEPEEGPKGFAVQRRRWIIERSFGWIARCRRPAHDHEST